MSTKSAAAAEATAEPISFKFKVGEYSVAPSSEWGLDALEAFEEGKLVGFLRAVLGDEQFEAFKATKPKVSDINEFVQELQKALGIAGN